MCKEGNCPERGSCPGGSHPGEIVEGKIALGVSHPEEMVKETIVRS